MSSQFVQLRRLATLRVAPSPEIRPTVVLETVGSGTGRLVEEPVESGPDGNLAFEAGDVLFGKLRPYLAKSLVIDRPLHGSSEFLCMTPSPRLNSRFLGYVVLSQPFLEHAESSSYGLKMPRTSWNEMGNFRVPLPPVEEQRRIADFLDDQVARIDDAASKVREQIALLSEWSDALIEGEFAETTKDCSSRTLGNLAVTGWVDIGRGNVISKETITEYPGDYPVYSSARENNGEIGSYGEYMFDEELVSWSVDGGGDVFFRPKHRFSVTNICAYARVRNKEALDTEYLALAMQRARARVNFDWQDKAHPGVVRGIYSIPVPSIEVQRGLVAKNLETTSMSREARGQMSIMTDRLEERKRALITAAVTGELDVTTARPIGMGKWVPNVGASVEAPAAAQASSIGGIG